MIREYYDGIVTKYAAKVRKKIDICKFLVQKNGFL